MVSFQVARVWKGHEDAQVLALSCAPDGRTFATASNPDIGDTAAPEVLLWDLLKGKRIAAFGGADSAIHREGGPPELHTVVSFSPGGKWLGLVDDEGVRLCSPKTGKLVRRLKSPMHGRVLRLAFTDGDGTVTGADSRGLVRRWDVAIGRCTFELDLDTSGIQQVAFCPRAELMALTFVNGNIQFWNLATRQYLKLLRGHRKTCYGLQFSPDGRRLVSTSEDGRVILWSVDTLEAEAEIDLAAPVRRKGRASPREGDGAGAWSPEDRPWAVAFAPDNSFLVVGFWDGSVRALDARTLKELARVRAHGPEEVICELAFSPDGSALLAGTIDGELCVMTVSANGSHRRPGR